MRLFRDWSISATVAGVVAVLVGYTSSVAVVFSAVRALGGNDRQVASTLLGLCVAKATVMLVLSLKWRKPVMVAWSTPGAAVIATAAAGGDFTLSQAVGAFIICALIIFIVGATGLFGTLLARIPAALAAALLAGVLTRFAIEGFAGAERSQGVVLSMFAAFVLARRVLPRFAVLITTLVGVAVALGTGRAKIPALDWSLARPIITTPTWSVAALVSIALPVFVVTMAGQNLPGVAAIRTAGYDVDVDRIVASTGFVSLISAFAGAFTVNLAAITAAMCLGPESHPDKNKRYVSSVACALTYLAVGLFGAAVAGLLGALGPDLVHAVAGLALIGTITSALTTATSDVENRDAAMVTFLVTLSGLTMAKVGSAFWGAAAGLVVLAVSHPRLRRAAILIRAERRRRRPRRPRRG